MRSRNMAEDGDGGSHECVRTRSPTGRRGLTPTVINSTTNSIDPAAPTSPTRLDSRAREGHLVDKVMQHLDDGRSSVTLWGEELSGQEASDDTATAAPECNRARLHHCGVRS